MKKTVFALLVVLALVAVACGGGGNTAQQQAPAASQGGASNAAAPTGAAQAGGGAAKATGQLQLMGWSSSDAENTRLQDLVKNYNGKYPNAQASLNLVPEYDTKLQTALAGGTPPDAFYVDSLKLPDLVKAGALAPGTGKVQDQEDFYPFATQAFTYNGTYYCPAKDFSTLALIVNTDMLNAAGVKPPTNWDELRAAAQKLTDPSKKQYGLVIPNDLARFAAFVYQAGGQIMSDDRTQSKFNSPEVKQAWDYYVGLYKDGYARMPSEVDAGWPGEAFGKGNAAMVVEGNWIAPFLKDKFPNIKWQAVELPAGPKGKATLAFTVCYAVPAKAKSADASWQLVNYLTGKEGMKAWTDLGLAMPTRKSLSADWQAKFPDYKAFAAGADYARPWQFVTGFSDATDTINNDLKAAFQGQMTTDQALKEADQVINQIAKNK